MLFMELQVMNFYPETLSKPRLYQFEVRGLVVIFLSFLLTLSHIAKGYNQHFFIAYLLNYGLCLNTQLQPKECDLPPPLHIFISERGWEWNILVWIRTEWAEEHNNTNEKGDQLHYMA